MKYSNVIDTPRQPGSDDLLGVDRYIEALTQFIRVAQMPTTLAIQGEWGSGKTSFMNQVRYKLCEMPQDGDTDKPYYGIWVNTWQYAMMRSPENTLINVLKGVTTKVLEIMRKHKGSMYETMTRVGDLFGKMVKVGAKAAVSATGAHVSIIDALMEGEDQEDAETFRKTLQKAIASCLEADIKNGNQKKGFIFFIDDLDRLDPSVAVQILELLKNLFEVDKCIFILAIDYDVVVKGLVPKFGPLTEKNEREFRSFFDKIIQLPFSMPVGNYNIDDYLAQSLEDIDYFTQDELWGNISGNEKKPVIDYLSNMAISSTGTNPRSVKRLINSLSLIQIMYNLAGNSDQTLSVKDKLLNFGFVCIQIAYPTIYNMLLFDSNYKMWGEKIVRRFKAADFDEQMKEQLAETGEFDEQWKQVLYRVCLNNSYLSARVFNISRLLDMLAELVGQEEDFGEEVYRIMSFAAVTTVSTGDDKAAVNERKQEYTNFWGTFLNTANNNEEFKNYFVRKKAKLPISNNLGVPFGVKGYTFYLDQRRRQNLMRIQFWISKDKKLFNDLFQDREKIEKIFDYEMEWEDGSSIFMQIPFNYKDESTWTTSFEEIANNMVKMRNIFMPYLKK